MKKIMILGASILQLPAIKKATEMGLQVIAVDMNPKAVGFKEDVIKEVISTIDTQAILECAKKYQIDGIITLASDMPMQSVAKVCRELNLVGISESTAIKATNKAYMRDALKESGVPIPLYAKVSDFGEFKKAVESIRGHGYKCIAKPVDNAGSRGVSLLNSDDDLKATYEYCYQYSRNGMVIVEEYMEGPEVSVETLAIDGNVQIIQITDKITTGPPYFVEMGHSQPSMLNKDTQKQIRQVTIAANKAIGIVNGPSHTEIKVTKDGPKIVELGARLGGDNITTHLVPLSTGIDMVECCIKIALGDKPNLEISHNTGAAIRYIKTKNGIIQKIEGVDKAKSIKGVTQVSIVHDVGEEVGEIKNSIDRAGFVIAKGETPSQAVKSAEEAISTISLVVR